MATVLPARGWATRQSFERKAETIVRKSENAGTLWQSKAEKAQEIAMRMAE